MFSPLLAATILIAFPGVAWPGGTYGGQIVALPDTAVDELARFRLALGLALVAVVLLVATAMRRPRASAGRGDQAGPDILAVPGIRRLPLWALYLSPEAIRGLLTGFGIWAPLIFIGLQALQVVISPIPGEATGVLGGFLFGTWIGALYSTLGLMLGSALAFGLSR